MSAEGSGSSAPAGRVILVGAGPGDPDLITLRGAAALARADVVLYDELATDELLSLASRDALLINVGKRGHDAPTRSQDGINALLVEHGRAGRTVVRLKGGDPFVFGRGSEEASVCVEAGIPFEVVPGVSSAIAALAYAGIPVTDRRYAASFAVVTGHKDPSKPARETRWGDLGQAVDTLVVLMGMRNLASLVAEMIKGGKSPDTPSAAIMNGSCPEQRVVTARLADLPDRVAEAGLRAPAAIAIGEVVRLRESLQWWERVPLFGMRVLVTRAELQARELATALRAAGAVPVLRPMIELVPVSDAEGLAAIESALARSDAYDAIVFSSTNAVRHFVEHAERLGVMEGFARGPARVLCIGSKTARAALDAGLPVSFVSSSGATAEAMLEEILGQGKVAGHRFLIPRSEIGRNVLPDGLRAAGAQVDAIQVYRNRRPEIDTAALRAELASDALDVLTFTSPSTVKHFDACLDEPARAAARRCIIAAIGATTARALGEAGFEVDVVPEQTEARALVAELSRHVASRGGRDRSGRD